MDEINVQVEFENASDRAVYERSYMPSGAWDDAGTVAIAGRNS